MKNVFVMSSDCRTLRLRIYTYSVGLIREKLPSYIYNFNLSVCWIESQTCR